MVPESKRTIAANVALQWLSLLANIVLMAQLARLLYGLYQGQADASLWLTTGAVAVAALLIRCVCTIGASRMSYLSAQATKDTLRKCIYEKLLRLGCSYSEKVKTSEVVQVAVEGVDQLETYFGAYLPSFSMPCWRRSRSLRCFASSTSPPRWCC